MIPEKERLEQLRRHLDRLATGDDASSSKDEVVFEIEQIVKTFKVRKFEGVIGNLLALLRTSEIIVFISVLLNLVFVAEHLFLLLSPSVRREPTPVGVSVSDERIVPVFFATDRARNPTVDLLDYSSRRNEVGGRFLGLFLGRVNVRVPEDHEIGKVERPSIKTLYIVDEKKHFVIRSVVQQTYDDFYADVSSRIGASARQEAFVFIHGYNVTFQDAVFRTAQIADDLKFQGAAILYSWPSLGTTAGYPDDYNNNEWTFQHLQYFLEDVVKRSGARVIHLIAHSMGNRALVYALNGMVASGTAPRGVFNQIVLAAPDIDASTFTQIAGAVTRSAQRTTLYASSEDKALKASAGYQGQLGIYRRAGDSKPSVTPVEGIDTMDATLMDTSLLGHSYYGSSRSILTDIFTLMSQNAPPSARFGVDGPLGKPPGQYWIFQK